MIETFVVKSGCTYGEKVGGGVITDLADVNNLVEGAIAFFNIAGDLITLINPPAGEYVIFASGRAVGAGSRLSTMISREYFEFVDSETPAVDAPKVMTLGDDTAGNGSLNTPTTIVEGDIAGFILTEIEKHTEDKTRTHRFEYECANGDTDAIMLAALLALFNADPISADYTMTVMAGDVGLNFTGPDGVNFSVIGVGVYENATRLEVSLDASGADYGTIDGVYDAGVATVAGETEPLVKTVGCPLKVAELERLAMENRGNSQSAVGAAKVATYTSNVEAGSIYYIYPCTFINDRINNPTVHSRPFTQQLNICVESTVADVADIETMLGLM